MEEPSGLRPLSASQMEELEEAVATYQEAVTPEVARYLIGRGIEEAEAVTYRLGVVDDPFPGHGHVRGFLSIPYLDRLGRPVGIRFRCLEEHDHREHGHGKYMSLPEQPIRTFNVRAIHEATHEIHIAEGELDAIILSKVGLPAIAVPGAEAWLPRHGRMVAGFSRVYVWADPDEAGAKFARRISNGVYRARNVRLRDGDVTETYLLGGPEALWALLKEGGGK